MGLIKAGLGALGGTLADQWKEFFYCDSLDSDTLMVKGEKRTGSRSSNTKGSDNVISNGSGIIVNDGQCMMIVEQGKIVEFCAEPGEFTYDTSSEPSIFAGSFGESVKNTFKTIGKRFTYGGDTGKDQRVYYFNTKQILDNKFGTATPIPFRVVVNEAMGFKLSVDIRCNGVYAYEITNPMLFYTELAGNVADSYTRDMLDPTLKADFLDALQPAISGLAAQGIEYFEIPGKTAEIRNAINEALRAEWVDTKGISIGKISINSLSIPDEQKKKITEWEENAMTTNPMVAGSRLVGAQADAMRTAAANEGGAMTGFMGMGMAMNAGGMNAQNLFQMGQQQAVPNPAATPNPDTDAMGWKCACGATATGKFCPECGAKKPEPQTGWKCACGATATGKFCQNCGAKKPAGAPLYRCDKCGWEPADPKNPPKFCPECGDTFTDDDIQ